MKKFIIKVTIFIFPIIFLQIFSMLFYSTEKGDLLRLGYIMEFYNYRDVFKEEFKRNNYFSKVSKINLNNKNKYTALTIGDSFSEQEGFGYKNYLAENDRIDILHFDSFLNNNPIQTTYGILNGDLLNNVKVDYIILQSVERAFVSKIHNIDRKKAILKDSLIIEIEKQNVNVKKVNISNKLLLGRMLNFPLLYKILYHNILFYFDDNAFGSQTYIVKTKQNLFSNSKNELLFYFGDLENLKTNNNLESVLKLNKELNILSNKLKEKGIKLIVLPSPDKFDFYYDDIVNKEKYTKPLFFDYLENMPKDYLYVNSKKILKSQMTYKKDIYFYDDTHWSPWASKVIAIELAKIISTE